MFTKENTQGVTETGRREESAEDVTKRWNREGNRIQIPVWKTRGTYGKIKKKVIPKGILALPQFSVILKFIGLGILEILEQDTHTGDLGNTGSMKVLFLCVLHRTFCPHSVPKNYFAKRIICGRLAWNPCPQVMMLRDNSSQPYWGLGVKSPEGGKLAWPPQQ